ncbi:hypothetical protein NFI96_007223 [Prochilodus magdalenae]|nr:hypothetical protein NFI96_007223 [Prochilodus magdalenae]
MNPAEQSLKQAAGQPMEITMEQAEQQQVRVALASQGAMIGRHEELLQQILTQLQTLSLAPQPVLQPRPPAAPEPAPQGSIRQSSQAESHLPSPEKYDGDPGSCRGFLLQCTLAFEQQPSRFPTERAKVAYIISLLTGRALSWATPVWEKQPTVCATSRAFMAALRSVFDHPVCGGEIGSRFFRIRQGRRSVADYAIEFRTLAAESNWNSASLMEAYHQGLSEELKDELAPRDPPSSLEDLIELSLRLDNRLRERRRSQRSKGGSLTLPTSTHRPDRAEEEPMQLGHTRLSVGELQARRKEGRCLYCGQPGHLRASCPELPGKSRVRHGGGDQ